MIDSTELAPPAPATEVTVTGPAVIWTEYRAKIAKLAGIAAKLREQDAAEKLTQKMAHETRLAAKKLRCDAENSRKDLVGGLKREAAAIDDSARGVKQEAEAIEEEMRLIEEHAARIEAARIAALKADRDAVLLEYGFNSASVNSGGMSEEEYDTLISGLWAAKLAKQAEEKRLAEEAADKARAEAEERERQRLETERLKAEAAEREAALKAEREARERERAEAEAARLAAERKADAERKAAEAKARAEREAIEAKVRKERQAREKIEAEQLASAAKESARVKAEEAERAAAAKAPDREKLLAIAQKLKAVTLPSLGTKEGRVILADIIGQLFTKAGLL